MVSSKRRYEGYAEIDHRESPGITPEFMRKNHLEMPAVPGGQILKTAFVVCHCCLRDIILNPDRSRERGYCSKHDAYLCDDCGAAQKAGAVCIPFKQRFDQWYDALVKGLPIHVD
jgi:hypothetical protein